MKKTIISLITLLFIGFSGIAQNPEDLKGPKAKNYKVWKSEKSAEPVISFRRKTKVQGPKAKNQKSGDRLKKRSALIVLVRDKKRSRQKGPAAKNYKSWK